MARYAALDEFDEEDALWPVWRPLLGTFVAILVLAFASAGSAVRMPASLAELAGYVTGQVALVYLILYFVALRRRGLGWKIGSLLLLVLCSAFFNLVQVGRQSQRLTGDMGNLRDDVRDALDGKQLTPGGAAANSFAGVTRNMLVAIQADQRSQVAEAEAAGATALLSPEALKRRPDVLANCARLDALSARAPFYNQQWQGRIAAARAAMQTVDAPEQIRNEALDGFDRAYARTRLETGRNFELVGLEYKELGAICRVLARRHWQGGARFLFTNDRDLADYGAVADRYNALFEEQKAIQARSRARTRASIQALDHALK